MTSCVTRRVILIWPFAAPLDQWPWTYGPSYLWTCVPCSRGPSGQNILQPSTLSPTLGFCMDYSQIPFRSHKRSVTAFTRNLHILSVHLKGVFSLFDYCNMESFRLYTVNMNLWVCVYAIGNHYLHDHMISCDMQRDSLSKTEISVYIDLLTLMVFQTFCFPWNIKGEIYKNTRIFYIHFPFLYIDHLCQAVK